MSTPRGASGAFRVLVTGSRDWARRSTVRGSLDSVGFEHGYIGLTVVHGACPTGADAYADEWARDNADIGVLVERVPARWDLHGKAAGPLRNAEMVARGAALCLAFPRGLSRGTRNCMAEARKAGIPVWNLGEEADRG